VCARVRHQGGMSLCVPHVSLCASGRVLTLKHRLHNYYYTRYYTRYYYYYYYSLSIIYSYMCVCVCVYVYKKNSVMKSFLRSKKE